MNYGHGGIPRRYYTNGGTLCTCNTYPDQPCLIHDADTDDPADDDEIAASIAHAAAQEAAMIDQEAFPPPDADEYGMIIRCPICATFMGYGGDDDVFENPTSPFCSQECADIDMAEWLAS